VDVDTLSFGPGGATPVFPPRYDDVNGDGAIDLVTQYRIRDAGLVVGDTEACLSGVVGGTLFTACDSIVTGPPFNACGIGFELVFALPPLLWLRRVRRRRVR